MRQPLLQVAEQAAPAVGSKFMPGRPLVRQHKPPGGSLVVMGFELKQRVAE
jgi:hypothetical protein